MPVTGRKPKPPGEAVHRGKPTHDWTEVENVHPQGGEDDQRHHRHGLEVALVVRFGAVQGDHGFAAFCRLVEGQE